MSPKQITHVERMKRRILQLESLLRESDAELRRHKRAIDWLLQGQICLRDRRLVRWLGGPYEAPIHVPSDIADLIEVKS